MDSDDEDFILKPTDNLLAVGKVTEEAAVLEVHGKLFYCWESGNLFYCCVVRKVVSCFIVVLLGKW